MDLLGRKILRSDGRGLAALKRRVGAAVERAREDAELEVHGRALDAAWASLETALAAMRAVAPERVLANATPFLQGFGHLTLAWLWLDQALAAKSALAFPGSYSADTAFYAGKLRACRYFFECELPKTRTWLGFASSASDVAAGVPVAQF